jgi:putative endonuclease
MPDNKTIGKQYEELAMEYLKQQGYVILEQNFRCRQGEIDLVAQDREYLCFIEVKYRKNGKRGLGMEAVTDDKQRKISRVALYYLTLRGRMEIPIRFDVVSIDGDKIHLIRNAFEYRG